MVVLNAVAFNNDEVKHCSCEGTTTALALISSKGFLLAPNKDSSSTAQTVKKYEYYGEIKVTLSTTVASTGGGGSAVAAVKHPTTATAKNKNLLTMAAA